MKNTAIILCITLSLGLLFQVQAQKTKVLESSSKKKPEWIGGVTKDYVITVSSASTLEDAQQKALGKVKEQIVSSVAENIATSSEYFKNETIKNNQTDFTENFTVATKTKAADIPFIKGISLNKVEEFYWEKIKENETVKFYYHLKYPFTQAQLKQLVDEYEKADQELTTKLESYINKIDNIKSTEMMVQTIKELEALSEAFIDVDPRKNSAKVGVSKLKEMLKNVSIETINQSLGEIRVALQLGDKTITTAQKPTVRSNCAKIIEIKNSGAEWKITYSYDECYEDPDNKITVSFRNSYGKYSNDYFFNINADKINIFVNNDIIFLGTSDNANCQIPIMAKYKSAFIITKVVLNFGNEAPIVIDNINKTFEGEGIHDLDLKIPTQLNAEIYSAKVNPMIKGTIHYKSVKTGEQSVYKMYNQKITTAW